MKRFILAAAVAALALTMGLSSVAVGADPAATTSAKKGKKKPCKAKKGKAKRSATVSTAKKKGAKKGCKKGKKPAAKKPAPEGPTGPPPPPPGPAWPPVDGSYSDAANGLGLTLSGGASSAALTVGTAISCFPLSVTLDPAPTIVTSKGMTAFGLFNRPIAGFPASANWKINVNTDMSYSGSISSSFDATATGGDNCEKTVPIQGTFVTG